MAYYLKLIVNAEVCGAELIITVYSTVDVPLGTLATVVEINPNVFEPNINCVSTILPPDVVNTDVGTANQIYLPEGEEKVKSNAFLSTSASVVLPLIGAVPDPVVKSVIVKV
jgi:hypothetical protein